MNQLRNIQDNEALFYEQWLTIQDYEFKLLIMIAILAKDHLAYRGTLADVCSFMGVSNQAKNTAKIKTAIGALEKRNCIKTIKEGYTWTLTLSTAIEEKTRIYKVQKEWVKAIKNYQCEKDKAVEWINVLKVLVFLSTDKKEIYTYKSIGDRLDISERIVERAVKALDNIELEQGEFSRKLKWRKINDTTFKIIGQSYSVGFKWS